MFNRQEILNTDVPIKKDLLRIFKKTEKLLIFDIGSCEGEDSIRYAKLFPNASVFAFEPLPKNQQLILDNITRHQASRVQLFKMALSKTEGWQDFYVSSGQPDGADTSSNWDFGNKSSSLLAPNQVLDTVKWLKFNTTISVYTNTLNNFMIEHQIKAIDFIHMDVQGAELDVLTGAGKYLQNIKVIWLEIAETPLYREQPLRTDVEKFMNVNSFKLIKTQIENEVGDQLYINTRYFSERSFLGLKRFKQIHPDIHA